MTAANLWPRLLVKELLKSADIYKSFIKRNRIQFMYDHSVLLTGTEHHLGMEVGNDHHSSGVLYGTRCLGYNGAFS